VTQAEASKLVAMLLAAYPNARVPDGTLALYESFLIELDRDRAVLAIRRIIRSSKFMPAIAEIVTAYEGEKAPEGEPYHRPFLPPRRAPRMKPADVQACVGDALAALEGRRK
jgi:hypothetical protein